MSLPQIRTRATNVELNEETLSLVRRQLAPLVRVLKYTPDAAIDVAIRRTETNLDGLLFVVSMKLTIDSSEYSAVASRVHLGRALASARHTIRCAISKGASVSPYVKPASAPQGSYTLTL